MLSTRTVPLLQVWVLDAEGRPLGGLWIHRVCRFVLVCHQGPVLFSERLARLCPGANSPGQYTSQETFWGLPCSGFLFWRSGSFWFWHLLASWATPSRRLDPAVLYQTWKQPRIYPDEMFPAWRLFCAAGVVLNPNTDPQPPAQKCGQGWSHPWRNCGQRWVGEKDPVGPPGQSSTRLLLVPGTGSCAAQFVWSVGTVQPLYPKGPLLFCFHMPIGSGHGLPPFGPTRKSWKWAGIFYHPPCNQGGIEAWMRWAYIF